MSRQARERQRPHRRPPQWRRLLRLASVLITGAAVAQELRKPAAQRTWRGTVAGYVPYDFRRPTLARYRSRMWAPEDPRLFPPQVYGVGWTLNVGRLLRVLLDAR